jgi:glycosyltransferase involved in cell wall biosynthesis
MAPLVERATVHGTSDSHADLPRWLSPMRAPLLRRIWRERMPWYKLSDLVAEARAFGACATGGTDIVHFLDGEHAPLFLPRLLKRARALRARVVATYHQPPGLLGDLVSPRVVAELDAVILVSLSQRDFFERSLPPERIHVIPHGIDCEFFSPREGPRRDGPLRCVTVGHWLRDWRVFRETAQRLPDVAFTVVSGRVTGLEDLPNVTVRSGLEDDALAAVYRDADVLFMPLIESTANNALLEGIACGLPVVTTDLRSVRSYLPDGTALLVGQGDGPGHARALERLLADAGLRARMGVSARRQAEAMAWPTIARAHLEIYEAVALQH